MIHWLSYIISPKLQGQVLGLKIFFLVLSTVFLVSAIYFLVKTNYLKFRIRKKDWVKDYRHFKSVRPRKKSKEWDKIDRLAKSDLVSENKLATVKAKDLLDKVLKSIGYPKGDWSERLSKAIADESFNLSPTLEACRTSALILKDPDHKIDRPKLQEAIDAFHQVLKQLNYF